MKPLSSLCVALMAASLAAQSPEKEVARLVKELRSPKLEAAQREDLVFQLLDYEQAGAEALKDTAERESRKLRRHYDRQRAKHLEAFEQAARKLQRERQGDKQVKLLRAEILLCGSDATLTRELIELEIDPKLADLRKALEVTVEQVLAAAPKSLRGAEGLDETDVDLLVWDDIGRRAEAALTFEPIAESGFETVQQARERLLDSEASLELDDLKVVRFNETQRDQLDPESFIAIERLNEIRGVVGLPMLRIDPKLCVAAKGHCDDMRELGFFDHESPVEGKRSAFDRAALAGTTASSENIAMGQNSGASVLRGWWYSPGHHGNLMSEASRIGMGRNSHLWTQMFGR